MSHQLDTGEIVSPENLLDFRHSRPCVSGYTPTRVTHGSDRDLVPLT